MAVGFDERVSVPSFGRTVFQSLAISRAHITGRQLRRMTQVCMRVLEPIEARCQRLLVQSGQARCDRAHAVIERVSESQLARRDDDDGARSCS